MGRIMRLTYSSSLSGLCEINSSFDSAVLRVAYTDKNRNGSSISREAYERSMATIFNCPVVCNYTREDNSIGGHDTELIHDENGMRFVNITQPVGVVPESAKQWWENVEEEDGTVHEYLCTDVLLWKRQEAYRKIKEDGITAESMEITVKDGRFNKSAGVYEIDNFEFTAFCLLGDGVEPCFEQAALEVFSANEFKKQMSEMMHELRETFTLVNIRENEVDINEFFAKGGNERLEEKIALIEEFGMSIDDLDFAIDDFSVDELREKLDGMKFEEDPDAGEGGDGSDAGEGSEGGGEDSDGGNSEGGASEDGDNGGSGSEGGGSGSGDPAPEDTDDDIPDGISRNPTHTDKYELNTQIANSIYETVADCGEFIDTPWGQEPKYSVVDFDISKGEIYVLDCSNWHIYGLPYFMNGDNVAINWACKKRMKCAYVEFDEGVETPETFSHFEEKYKEKINELNQFKLNVEEKEAQTARDEVIAKFNDLEGVEAFEAIKENNAEYSAESLEEKCFAIRGRMAAQVTFSLEHKVPKIMVDQTREENEPYGGIVRKYSEKN